MESVLSTRPGQRRSRPYDRQTGDRAGRERGSRAETLLPPLTSPSPPPQPARAQQALEPERENRAKAPSSPLSRTRNRPRFWGRRRGGRLLGRAGVPPSLTLGNDPIHLQRRVAVASPSCVHGAWHGDARGCSLHGDSGSEESMEGCMSRAKGACRSRRGRPPGTQEVARWAAEASRACPGPAHCGLPEARGSAA